MSHLLFFFSFRKGNLENELLVLKGLLIYYDLKLAFKLLVLFASLFSSVEINSGCI